MRVVDNVAYIDGDVIVPYDELVELRKRFNLSEDEEVICSATRSMAPVFQVSLQAMQIQLRDLGLINVDPDNQMYFDF